MWFRIAVSSALSLAASAAVVQAAAPSEADRVALKQRCGGDYATYCGDVPPDGPEVRACFRRNMASLSPACRSAIEHHGKRGAKG